MAAKRYLETQPVIDKNRIAVIGYSHGGVAALHTALNANFSKNPFQAVIAFYPYCNPVLLPIAGKNFTPLMILIGEKDDWCPAKMCEDYEQFLKGGANEFVLKVYPGATHFFDKPGGTEYYGGHVMTRDEAAIKDATVMVRNFLKKYL